jgi:hypothetical protein
VAPTFNVEDLDKRIQELKAVHFWLDQNSRALAATIQALEVQKMTLATLQGMNVSMGDVANAMKIKTADAMASLAGFAGMGGKATESPATQVTPPHPRQTQQGRPEKWAECSSQALKFHPVVHRPQRLRQKPNPHRHPQPR